MVSNGGVRLFQRPTIKAAGAREISIGRGAGGCPYTEEELSFNVRRALEELRQDFPDHQPPKVITWRPSPVVAASNGNEMAPPPNTLTPGPNRYVVNCVNGVVRVMAVPTSPVEDSGVVATKRNPGAVVDVIPNPPEAKSKSPVQSSSCSKPISHSGASLSSRQTGSSATTSCARKWDQTAQPLILSPDASCSSGPDGGSEILDSNGLGTASVASWALSSRDDHIPHPKFFFKDGTLELLVEHSLYKVHRHFFEHYSSLFPAIFTCLGPARLASASRARVPIHLPDITTIDFDRLLSILYPTSYAQCDVSNTEEWISVLDISSKLEFASIYELSICNIAPKASILDKAILGRRYGVKSWVVDSYSELCTREKPLALEEGRKLGIDLVIKINELRHELFIGNGAGTDPHATSSMCSLNFFDELPEKVIQHFNLHRMDEGVPEGDGNYFKAVIDANRS